MQTGTATNKLARQLFISSSSVVIESGAQPILANVRPSGPDPNRRILRACINQQEVADAINKQSTIFEISEAAQKENQIPHLEISKDCMEHIVTCEIHCKPVHGDSIDLVGFHHDRLGIIEQSGFVKFEIIKTNQNGVIEVHPTFAGKICKKPKTLFPSHWTTEDVFNCVRRAAYNVKKDRLSQKGLYLRGKDYKTNVMIEFKVDQAAMQYVVTFYPVI